MAGIQITNLQTATSINGEDTIVIVQNNVTKKSQVKNLRSYFNGSISNIESNMRSLENNVQKLREQDQEFSEKLTNDYYSKTETNAISSNLSSWVKSNFAPINSSGSGSSSGIDINDLTDISSQLYFKITDVNDQCNSIKTSVNAISNSLTLSVENLSSELRIDIDRLLLSVDSIDDTMLALFKLSALSDGMDLLTATVKLNEKLSALDTLSTYVLEKVVSNDDEISTLSAQISSVSGDVDSLKNTVFTNIADNSRCLSNSTQYNPLLIEIGNLGFRKDVNTFGNVSVDFTSDSSIDDKYDPNFFDLNGIPLRASQFNIVEEKTENDELTSKSYIFKVDLQLDSDVSLYANRKLLLSTSDSIHGVQLAIDAFVNEQKIPFALENSDYDETQNDFVLKYYAKLSAGSTITISAGNDATTFLDENNNVKHSIAELFTGSYAVDNGDALIAMFRAIPTTEAISRIIEVAQETDEEEEEDATDQL